VSKGDVIAKEALLDSETAPVYFGDPPNSKYSPMTPRAEILNRRGIRVKPSPTFKNDYQSGQIIFGQLVNLHYGIEAGDIGDVRDEDLPTLKESFKSIWED